MCVTCAVRTALVLALLGWEFIFSPGAPASDGDPKAKAPPVELQNPTSTGEQAGALPSDRSAYRAGGTQAGAAATKPKAPRITADRETTYILQPLRADGFPDYFAALNERCRGALKPENNAAILLLQAFGPSAIPAEIQDEYFHLLGNKFQRPVGAYFVRTSEMADRWRKGTLEHGKDADQLAILQAEFATAAGQPWSRAEFPMVAEWLAINDLPMQKIADAAARPRFYEPVVAANRHVPALWSVALPMEQYIAEVAIAFEARAMLRANQNDFTAAGDDLLACAGLLRKLAAYPIGQYAVEARTAEIGLIQTQLKLLHFCRPTPEQIERFEKQWNALPPMPGIVDRIDVGDRFRFLDAVCLLSRKGASALQQLFGDLSSSADETPVQKAVEDALFDWNEPLKMGNRWFDEQAVICRIADRKERQKALENSRRELQTTVNDAGRPSFFSRIITLNLANAADSRKVGASLIQLFDVDLPGTLETCDQYTLHSSFAQTGLALAAYRADHGRYPKQLDELAPKYLARLPRDLYTDRDALRYHREPDGYTLYSVGQNGQDEQGSETVQNPNSDDIAITITDAASIAARQ